MGKRSRKDVSLCVVICDLHYPYHDVPGFKALLNFIKVNRNQIDEVILNGDCMDCQNLSRHTVGKPRLRERGGYKEDLEGFKNEILKPLNDYLKRGTTKVYICGNHEDWIQSELLDEMPELEGVVGIPENLKLKSMGWEWKECGEYIEFGNAVILHGNQIGSGLHIAKKLVDSCSANCVMGHVHTASMFTKTSQVSAKKYAGYTLPCLSTLAPHYAKGKPNAFVHGFGIIEKWAYSDNVNIYPVIIINGQFSFGGKFYQC